MTIYNVRDYALPDAEHKRGGGGRAALIGMAGVGVGLALGVGLGTGLALASTLSARSAPPTPAPRVQGQRCLPANGFGRAA
jgi:hypothetical protein